MEDDLYKLVPWSQLSSQAQQIIKTNEAKNNQGRYINPEDYEKSSFYVDKNGNIAKGKDVDKWRWSNEKERLKMIQEDPDYAKNLWKRIEAGLEIPVFSKKRTEAQKRHPYATQLAGSSLSATGEFVDVNLPWLKVTRPTWWASNIAKGRIANPFNYNEHDNGIFDVPVLQQYADKKWAPFVNTGLDIGLTYGIGKFLDWGTTPRVIGRGTFKEAVSAPFSNKVRIYGGDANYMAEQSQVPHSLKYKYEGTTLDGRPIHTTQKVRMIKNPGRKLFQKMADNDYFPTEYGEDSQLAFVNPSGVGLFDVEFGKDFFGRSYIVDPEPLSLYDANKLYKNGGVIK